MNASHIERGFLPAGRRQDAAWCDKGPLSEYICGKARRRTGLDGRRVSASRRHSLIVCPVGARDALDVRSGAVQQQSTVFVSDSSSVQGRRPVSYEQQPCRAVQGGAVRQCYGGGGGGFLRGRGRAALQYSGASAAAGRRGATTRRGSCAAAVRCSSSAAAHVSVAVSYARPHTQGCMWKIVSVIFCENTRPSLVHTLVFGE